MSIGNFLVFSSPGDTIMLIQPVNESLFGMGSLQENAQRRAGSRHLQGTALVLSQCLINIGDDEQKPR